MSSISQSSLITLLPGADAFGPTLATRNHERHLTSSSVSSVGSSESLFEVCPSNTSSTMTTPEGSPKSSPVTLKGLEDPPVLVLPQVAIQPTSEEHYLTLPTNSIPCPTPPMARLIRPLTKKLHKEEVAFHLHIETIYSEALFYDEIRALGRPPIPALETNHEYNKSLLWSHHMKEMNPPLPLPTPESALALEESRSIGEMPGFKHVCFNIVALVASVEELFKGHYLLGGSVYVIVLLVLYGIAAWRKA